MRPIDGDALIVAIERMMKHQIDADDICEMIQNFPPIEPEREKGKWILSDDKYWKTCSECGVYVDVSMGLGIYNVNNNEVSEMRFCPNCGADMRGEQND